MNKLISIFLILLLTATTVLAFGVPHVIHGTITQEGVPVKNVEVKVTNLATKISTITTTDSTGFYMVELSNVDSNFRDLDPIEVTLVYCETFDQCSKTTEITGGEDEVSFDTAVEQLPALPETSIVIKYICSNGLAVDNPTQCPVITPPIPEPVVITETIYSCVDGTQVTDLADCPIEKDSWWNFVIGAIIAFMVSLGGAGGWKIYNGKFKHYHKGISEYHDPNTRHTVSKYAHTTWKVSPVKCIKDTAKIQKGIDLSQ